MHVIGNESSMMPHYMIRINPLSMKDVKEFIRDVVDRSTAADH